jgi:heptaprenyl diphosphate synthase
MKTEQKKNPSKGDRSRARRRAAARDLFQSKELFLAGFLTMPALLFNPSITLRTAQFILFWICAWAVGKRNSPLNTLIVCASIIGFNLIIPYGRVLAMIGSFRITQGALLAGIEKAVTVEGLIMLSKATVRSDLRLPGRFGALIGESFRYLELIMEKKGGIDRKDPIGGVDRLLIELSAPQKEEPARAEPSTDARTSAESVDTVIETSLSVRRAGLGRAILVAGMAIAWAPLALPFAFR